MVVVLDGYTLDLLSIPAVEGRQVSGSMCYLFFFIIGEGGG